MNKIVFYHYHVNGDAFSSRIFVKHIIDIFKDSVEYYYTAPRCKASHCLDIGIPDKNFNYVSIPTEANNSIVYFSNGILYIDLWIGNYYNFCCFWCFIGYIEYYNEVIDSINNLNITSYISYISKDIIPYIKFNYDFYNCKFFNEYFNKFRIIFSKIILVYNSTPTTYIMNVNHNLYVDELSNKYPNYLFLTFSETDIKRDNVKTVKTFYSENNTIPIDYGIEFSYLTFFCDKVIYTSSGITYLSIFNENNIKNKYIMLSSNTFYDTNLVYFGNRICDKYYDEYLCPNKHNIFIHKIFTPNDNLTNELDAFIDLPLIINE